jgi:hypothetical protein
MGTSAGSIPAWGQVPYPLSIHTPDLISMNDLIRYGDLSDDEQDELEEFVGRHVLANQDNLIRNAMDLDDIRIHTENYEGYVMEWWLIDDYLARELKRQGETVLENHNCKWWGRVGTGQRIILDTVIVNIWNQSRQ